jgi:hypothetical protein
MFFWPTWADIIATDLNDIEYQNWGLPGLGNVGIQSRIVEADMKHKLQPDDLMIILWSSWSREDRFMGSGWQSGGSVFNNHYYDDHFINKYWSWENDVVKNSTVIHMTSKAYKDIIKYQGSMTIFPSFHKNTDITPFLNKLLNKIVGLDDPLTKFYKDNLVMPECFNMTQHNNNRFSGRCNDAHPDVLCHLSYVENTIYPKLGYVLKDSTKQLFTEIQKELTSVFTPEDSLQLLEDKTVPVLAKYKIKKATV